jgi:poly(A) polymerase
MVEEWIIRALATVREIRDWAGDLVETAMDDSKTAPLPAAPAPAAPAPAAAAPAPLNGQSEAAKKKIEADVEAAQRSIDEAMARRERRMKLAQHKQTVTTESPEQEIPLAHIDPHAIEVLRRLRRFGYRAYLVGGCVRDLLLGLTPKDHDIATSARPEEVKSLFRNSRVIGRRFRLVHVYFRGGKIIEVATFRANASIAEAEEDGEEAVEQDLLIRRDNVFGTEEEDARRRDFTINASSMTSDQVGSSITWAAFRTSRRAT